MIIISGNVKKYQEDSDWKDLVLFYEYFHGDTGRGCGARWVSLFVIVMIRVVYL